MQIPRRSRGDRRSDHSIARRPCGCSGCRNRAWPRRCATRSTQMPRLRRAGDHHLSAARGGRDGHPLRTGRRGHLPAADCNYFAHGTASSSSPRTAHRSMTRSRGCWPGAGSPQPSRAPAGLLAARLTERAGSSAYLAGGARRLRQRGENRICSAWTRRSSRRTERYRNRSPRRWPTERCAASARTPRSRSPGSPVPVAALRKSRSGTVCFSVELADGRTVTRTVLLPGNRADVRDRSTRLRCICCVAR